MSIAAGAFMGSRSRAIEQSTLRYALADWVNAATDNGEVDVLILYGYFPTTIYGAGNAQPNNSLAELFIESTDGDAIINHGDWMFYVSDAINGTAGLQNMMDLGGVNMAGNDNAPMFVTDIGREIAPNLKDFLTDRPLHINTLGGEWVVEAALAQSANGLLAEPVIVRDGNRGRLILCIRRSNRTIPRERWPRK